MPILTVQKQWLVKHPNPQLQVELSDKLGVHPIIAQLLINRDVKTPEDADLFLSDKLSKLYDPFLLKDMDVAVKRVKEAKEKNETVLVFGDYDADGVTSSAILHNALKREGLKVLNYIPHRIHDGYGLNHEIGEFAKENGVTLLITVDCGISAHSEVETINKLGIDVVILDHHVPSEASLPNALAVINPKRKDCPYPFEHLAAVGLAAKFSEALSGTITDEELELVAIGTVADVVPLIGENRIYVKHGLPKIAQTQNKGLKALLGVAKVKNKKIRPHFIGFIIGPRINATGRMDSAQKSLDLLLSKDDNEALALANFLEKLNSKRQKLQNDLISEALAIVEQEVNFKDQKVIVIGKEGWHKGVLGIVASRIAETYYRPTVVISMDEGVGSGSARSIEGFNLYEALTHCSSLLENYGGHKGAAGLTVKEENINEFKEMLNDFAQENFDPEHLVPSIDVDCEIPLSSLNMDLVKIIDSMEPYGEGNPTPLFCTRQLIAKSPPMVLGKDTLKFWVTDGQASISAVGFRMGKYSEFVKVGQKLDLVYEVSIDDWNKAPTVQLKLKDIRPSSV